MVLMKKYEYDIITFFIDRCLEVVLKIILLYKKNIIKNRYGKLKIKSKNPHATRYNYWFKTE